MPATATHQQADARGVIGSIGPVLSVPPDAPYPAIQVAGMARSYQRRVWPAA